MSISKLGCGDGGKWYPTDTKEDKPMKTKVHELLGVEPNEPVDLVYVRQDGSENVHHKNVAFDDNGYLFDQYKNKVDMFTLADTINGSLKVRRRPAYTAEQVKTMKWLVQGGLKTVTVDPDKEMSAYSCTARRANGAWFADQDTYTGVYGKILDCLRPLIKDWTVPLDLLAALRDVGEEA